LGFYSNVLQAKIRAPLGPSVLQALNVNFGKAPQKTAAR
jgi:hypothetical protein